MINERHPKLQIPAQLRTLSSRSCCVLYAVEPAVRSSALCQSLCFVFLQAQTYLLLEDFLRDSSLRDDILHTEEIYCSETGYLMIMHSSLNNLGLFSHCLMSVCTDS